MVNLFGGIKLKLVILVRAALTSQLCHQNQQLSFLPS